MKIVNTREIKRRRSKLGLSMASAAKLAGWKTAQQWANVEYGTKKDPLVSTMFKVAKALGCKIDDLVKR